LTPSFGVVVGDVITMLIITLVMLLMVMVAMAAALIRGSTAHPPTRPVAHTFIVSYLRQRQSGFVSLFAGRIRRQPQFVASAANC
jgi:flagellar basal body-associated protein FliL